MRSESHNAGIWQHSSITVIGVATDVSQAGSSPAGSNKKRENSVDSNRSLKERKDGTYVSKGCGKKSLAKNPKLTTDNK